MSDDLDAARALDKAIVEFWAAVDRRDAKAVVQAREYAQAALRAERVKAIAECLNLNYEQRKALFDACQQAQEGR